MGVTTRTPSGTTGAGGGEINVNLSSFPDYVDPQLSYVVEGWEVLWNVYTPLLTYKHQGGDAGTEVVPGLAEDMPEISADGKTYKLKLRPNMKYSDGTPIKASDFTYAIQRLFKTDSGGSVFYDVIVGATDYADGKADTISGITTNDETGDITIQLAAPNGTFNNVLGLMFAAPVPPNTPLDEDATNSPPPSSGPFMISSVDAPRTPDDGAQPELPDGEGRRRRRGGRRPGGQDHRHREQEQQRPGHRRRAEQGRLHGRPAGGRPAGRGQGAVRRSVPARGVDQHLLLLDEHPEATVQRPAGPPGDQLRDRPRGPEPDLRRSPAPDPADPAAGHARLPGVQAVSRS